MRVGINTSVDTGLKRCPTRGVPASPTLSRLPGDSVSEEKIALEEHFAIDLTVQQSEDLRHHGGLGTPQDGLLELSNSGWSAWRKGHAFSILSLNSPDPRRS